MAKKKLEKKTLNIAGKDVEIAEIPITEAPPKDVKLTEEERALYEREIRRYIKSTGGYRKGVDDKTKVLCRNMLQALGRPMNPDGLCWDRTIIIPGFDKPTVRGMIVKE